MPNSYIRHVWVRNSDRAALTRMVFRDDARGPLTFDRPAFNEARDPGPPTADVFEPAPSRPHPVEEVPTPEPRYTPLPVIGGVRTIIESDYRVDSLAVEGEQLHLHIFPIRDVERNRLREVFCDKKTYELSKLISTDKLFVEEGPVYPATFTMTMGVVQGVPVVTDIHGDRRRRLQRRRQGRRLQVHRHQVSPDAAGLVLQPPLLRPARQRRRPAIGKCQARVTTASA